MSALRKAREDVAAAIAEAFPDWIVYTAPTTVDQVPRPTVIVQPATLPGDIATGCADGLTVETVLLAGDPVSSPRVVVDATDDMSDDLDAALRHRFGLLSSTPAVYADRFICRTLLWEVIG